MTSARYYQIRTYLWLSWVLTQVSLACNTYSKGLVRRANEMTAAELERSGDEP